MAKYQATIDTVRTPEDVFAYLSDFSTAAGCDPGVVEAERLERPGRASGEPLTGATLSELRRRSAGPR